MEDILLMTLFEAITTDEETLAANIINASHDMLKRWEAAHGRKPPDLNFTKDWVDLIKALRGDATEIGQIKFKRTPGHGN